LFRFSFEEIYGCVQARVGWDGLPVGGDRVDQDNRADDSELSAGN
jgi:hypothetical protein